MTLKEFIHEIHRRSVWQVMLIYLGASWGVLQVVDQIQQRLALPASTYGIALTVLLIGLPIVFATAFTQDVEPDAKSAAALPLLTRKTLTAALVFVLAGAGLVYTLRFSASPRGHADSRSIAVLPFTNMSPNADDAFFADGVHEEILTQLSRIAALDVRSRTSVLEYKNTRKNLRQVARELGVRFILEGSVRRAGDQTRITAQLIDADEDKHLWAETYDGSRSDVFGMQSTVAGKIAASLAAELSPAERARLNKLPTTNADAYDLLLRAREYGNRGYAEQDVRNRITLARQAVALDPNFAQAYAELSRALGQLYWFHYDRRPALRDSVRLTAERAIELDPTLPDGHSALGSYLYNVKLDYSAALAELSLALKTAPNDASTYYTIASVLRRKGDMHAARTEFTRASAMDPRNPRILLNLGETEVLLRRYADALVSLERAMKLAPDETDAALIAVRMYVENTGEAQKARNIIARYGTTGRGSYNALYAITTIELLDRKPDAALAALRQVKDDVFMTQFYYAPRALLMARAYQQKGDAANAHRCFTKALAVIDSAAATLADDPRIYSARAHALAGLGRKGEAIDAAKRATELMPFEKEAYRGAIRLRDLAAVYAATGEADQAITILERLLALPANLDVGALRTDPAWDPLRGNARFQKLIR